MPRAILLFAVIILLCAACTHPLEIEGEGDIMSLSGERDCLLEEQPCDIGVAFRYLETYTAVPRPGYVFVGWEGCGEQFPDCSFDIPAEVVGKFWGETTIPLVAKFAVDCDFSGSSFGAIQTAIFAGKGCTSAGCHGGGSAAGGMSLAPSMAYDNIVGMVATSSPLQRVQAGSSDNSYLYRKVSAKTLPGSFAISGSPMPLVGFALSQMQLSALALWIDEGAPETGTVGDQREVAQLLSLCD